MPPPQNLAELFAAHANFVFRVLRRLGVAEADVDDALQEVFLVVNRRLAEYEERGTARAWIFQICAQVASHARRAATRRARNEAHAWQGAAPADPLEATLRNEAVATVQGFLASLDEPRAMVFYLADVEGLTAPEVAECLGLNLNTVYGRLRWARQKFEALLASQGADASDPEGA